MEKAMATRVRSVRSDLYEADVVAWAEAQAEALRAGRLDDLDLANLAEEIQGLADRDRRELRSRLRVLVMHLLKWQHQPDQRSHSWDATIDAQRADLDDLLESSPSLRREVPDALAKVYPRAARSAAKETGLPPATFPETCPFAPDQILGDWMP
jgi:hypothetical protein